MNQGVMNQEMKTMNQMIVVKIRMMKATIQIVRRRRKKMMIEKMKRIEIGKTYCLSFNFFCFYANERFVYIHIESKLFRFFLSPSSFWDKSLVYE